MDDADGLIVLGTKAGLRFDPLRKITPVRMEVPPDQRRGVLGEDTYVAHVEKAFPFEFPSPPGMGPDITKHFVEAIAAGRQPRPRRDAKRRARRRVPGPLFRDRRRYPPGTGWHRRTASPGDRGGDVPCEHTGRLGERRRPLTASVARVRPRAARRRVTAGGRIGPIGLGEHLIKRLRDSGILFGALLLWGDSWMTRED